MVHVVVVGEVAVGEVVVDVQLVVFAKVHCPIWQRPHAIEGHVQGHN